jgi:gp45 sliding clamp, C terminal
MKLKSQTMKLSDNTLALLKNFAGINNSILVKTGNRLRTISVAKNILAEAEITEDFPRDFAIYDLNQFLNGLSLHQDPDLDFTEESHLSIKEGKRRVKYFFADPNVIISPPDKDIQLPSQDVCFQLDSTSLEKLVKAAAVYQLPDLSAVGENGVIKLVVRDKKNDTSNEYAIVVGETDKEFIFNFKVENIKIIPGAYDVVVSSKLLSRFTSKNHDLCYYIALEPDSTFE